MTWLYLNLNLGKLTGNARYYDMVEQTLYNHLLGAQSPDGRGWAYYMGLRDSKRFRWHTDPDCCSSRGVRALAQMPQHIINNRGDGLVVNFYEDSEANICLSSGLNIQTKMETRYPFTGDVKLTIRLKELTSFKVYLRLPGWCKNWKIRVNDLPQQISPDISGYLVIERSWSSGDQIELQLEMPVNILVDDMGNNGRVAITRGPLVYAADNSYLPDGKILDDVILLLNKDNPNEGIHGIEYNEADSVHLVVPMAVVKPHEGTGGWYEGERYFLLDDGKGINSPTDIRLVPFFEAGTNDPKAYKDGVWENTEPVTSVTYQVWLPYIFSE